MAAIATHDAPTRRKLRCTARLTTAKRAPHATACLRLLQDNLAPKPPTWVPAASERCRGLIYERAGAVLRQTYGKPPAPPPPARGGSERDALLALLRLLRTSALVGKAPVERAADIHVFCRCWRSAAPAGRCPSLDDFLHLTVVHQLWVPWRMELYWATTRAASAAHLRAEAAVEHGLRAVERHRPTGVPEHCEHHFQNVVYDSYVHRTQTSPAYIRKCAWTTAGLRPLYDALCEASPCVRRLFAEARKLPRFGQYIAAHYIRMLLVAKRVPVPLQDNWGIWTMDDKSVGAMVQRLDGMSPKALARAVGCTDLDTYSLSLLLCEAHSLVGWSEGVVRLPLPRLLHALQHADRVSRATSTSEPLGTHVRRVVHQQYNVPHDEAVVFLPTKHSCRFLLLAMGVVFVLPMRTNWQRIMAAVGPATFDVR
jgi:hypothetical protein